MLSRMQHDFTMKTLICFMVLLAVVYCQEGNAHDKITQINKALIDKSGDYEKETSTFGSVETELFEGDILMNKKLRKYLKKKRNGEDISPFDAIVNGQWPNGRVPFDYSRLRNIERKVVDAAIAHYKKHTCIRFVPKTSSDTSYVRFFIGGGCYSMIGRQGGIQQISIGNGCGQIGVVIHEMMHALGFFHEQSRRDRGKYIRIMWNNIPSRVRYNFEMYRPGQADTQGEPYDKQSVMHYGNYAFSTNRRKTIVSISNPNEVLGQRRGLSAIDIKQLNKYYKCGGRPVVTSKPTSGCSDGYSLCPTLAKNQLCNARVSTWVKNNCKKSCNNCPTPPPTPPKPQKPRCKTNIQATAYNCRNWHRSGYCTAKYVKFMNAHCSICGKCL